MPADSNNIDHLGVFCPPEMVDEEVNFLTAALGPLGIKEQFRIMPQVVAMGDKPQNAFLWVSGLHSSGPLKSPVTPMHLAFKAKGNDVAPSIEEFVALTAKQIGKPLMTSTRRLWRPVAKTMELRVSGASIMLGTMELLSLIHVGTILKLSFTKVRKGRKYVSIPPAVKNEDS